MSLHLEDIKKYGNLELLARKAVEGFITGLHKSPYHGFSVEFAEHKQYNTGDSTRHIDWKVFARTDKLYLKRYEEETNLRCQILLDTSGSMYYPSEDNGKLVFSVYAAAALSFLLQKQRDAVGLMSFNEEIDVSTPIKSSSGHIHKLLLQMEKILSQKKPNKKSSIASTLHQVANTLHRRSLVVIFSDMFENKESHDELIHALQHLKHNKHEILVFHVLDGKSEIDFEFENRPHLFVDTESGEKIKITPSQVKEEYKKNIQQFMHEVKLKCGQYKIDFIDVDIRKSLDQVLLPYLIKRSKML